MSSRIPLLFLLLLVRQSRPPSLFLPLGPLLLSLPVLLLVRLSRPPSLFFPHGPLLLALPFSFRRPLLFLPLGPLLLSLPLLLLVRLSRPPSLLLPLGPVHLSLPFSFRRPLLFSLPSFCPFFYLSLLLPSVLSFPCFRPSPPVPPLSLVALAACLWLPLVACPLRPVGLFPFPPCVKPSSQGAALPSPLCRPQRLSFSLLLPSVLSFPFLRPSPPVPLLSRVALAACLWLPLVARPLRTVSLFLSPPCVKPASQGAALPSLLCRAQRLSV